MKIQNGLVTDDRTIPVGMENDQVVITDSNVYNIYTDLIRTNPFIGTKHDRIIVIPPGGEKSKSLQMYRTVINKLSEIEDNGFNVKRIVAIGGGVVGDLAGFTASTYKRGLRLLHVPTTLVGMIDSSIGGKNEVNVGRNKNYIGTFHYPEDILIDPVFLKTLPEKEMKNGIAEIIKYSFVFGKPRIEDMILQLLYTPAYSDNVYDIIRKCCKIKSRVVRKSKRNPAYRNTLNFGHTIGHAIELLTGISHGEAVAIGMNRETLLAEHVLNGEKYTRKRLQMARILNKAGLPFKIGSYLYESNREFKTDDIMDTMKKDKKGELVFAFDKKNYSIKVDEVLVRDIIGLGLKP